MLPCDLRPAVRGPLLGPGSGFELVAHPLDRHDAVVADFLPQLADVDVDGAVADHHLGAPHLDVDLFARDELSGRGGQQLEQRELLAREVDLAAVAPYRVAGAVDLDAARGGVSNVVFMNFLCM